MKADYIWRVFLIAQFIFYSELAHALTDIGLTCNISFPSSVNQSVQIKKPPVTWYALNNSTGPAVSLPSLGGSVYSDDLLVSSVSDILGESAAQQLQDYLIYEASIYYQAQVCAANSTFIVYPTGRKGVPKNCDAGYACITNNDAVVFPLKVSGPGLIQASTAYSSTCNSGYALSGAYGSLPPPLLLTDVPDITQFHTITLKNLSVNVTAPSMYGPSGTPVPSSVQTLKLNCSSKAIPVTVNVPLRIDFGDVSTGSEDIAVPLTVTSNAGGLTGVTVSVSPSGAYDSEGIILGGGHVSFYNASDGVLIQPGKGIPLKSGESELRAVLSGAGASPGEATAGVIFTVLVP